MAEWLQASRLKGVARYHYKNLGRLIGWALMIFLVVQILTLVMPVITGHTYPFEGIGASFEIVFFAALVTGIITAGRSSRFLLRFGTSRTSVWLGSVLGQLIGMVALLLATFLVSILVAALLFPLSTMFPGDYGMSTALYQAEFAEGFDNLPELLRYSLEWTAIFYLYGCLLRRFKVLTISVSIGIPLMFVVLMLIPTVREGLTVLRGDNQAELLLLGLNWLKILQDVLRFIDENWDTIQLSTAIASLPLSYLVMRGTKQP